MGYRSGVSPRPRGGASLRPAETVEPESICQVSPRPRGGASLRQAPTGSMKTISKPVSPRPRGGASLRLLDCLSVEHETSRLTPPTWRGITATSVVCWFVVRVAGLTPPTWRGITATCCRWSQRPSQYPSHPAHVAGHHCDWPARRTKAWQRRSHPAHVAGHHCDADKRRCTTVVASLTPPTWRGITATCHCTRYES